MNNLIPVSDMLDNLMGHFEIDLGIDHIFFPGGYGKKMNLPAGYVIGQHRHKVAHTSIYSGGPVIIRTDDGEYELPAGAGSVETAAHVAHQIEAIGDVIWICLWETDETDPDKIDALVVEE